MSKRAGRYVRASMSEKNPMRFRVLNKPLHDTDETVGQCFPDPDDDVREIEIDPRQCPQEYMDTVIHEALHHLFPRASEPRILHAGTSIARLLWRLGYRRKK